MPDKPWDLEDVRKVVKENAKEVKDFVRDTHVAIPDWNKSNNDTIQALQELRDEIHEVDRKHFKWYMSLYVVCAITLLVMVLGFILTTNLNSWSLWLYTNPKLQMLVDNTPEVLRVLSKFK